MAARKKEDALAGFTVVLEDIRSQFRVFGESLQGLSEKMDARFDAVDCRFEAVDRRFDAVDRRFEAVDRRFDAADARSDAIDARLDRTNGELALVKVAVLENSRDLKELRGTVARIEQSLEKKVDRDEVELIVARVLAR